MKAMGSVVSLDGGRKAVAAPRIASREELESTLFSLQMEGNCFIQLSDSMEDSVRYISSLTTTISTMPERR
jgi:hypothetical protein